MDTMASDIRNRFKDTTPRINYVVAVDSKCIRLDYSSEAKLHWLEIWKTEGSYKILLPAKPRNPITTDREGVMKFLKTQFVAVAE